VTLNAYALHSALFKPICTAAAFEAGRGNAGRRNLTNVTLVLAVFAPPLRRPACSSAHSAPYTLTDYLSLLPFSRLRRR